MLEHFIPDMPYVSVIIRTFNEQKHLPGLLEILREQTCRDIELIVVDSGSTDRTREIAQACCDKVVCIESKDFTFGYSLNMGIQNSAGRYIAIVSAHTKPVEATWLERLTEPLHNDRTAMVYGRQVGWETSKFSEIQDFHRTFGKDREILKPPRFFANNANSSVRKDLWERHRFDEALTGLEDIEWAKFWMKKGYEVVYEPDAAIYHIHEETWPQVQRRYFREAVAARRIGIKKRRQIPFELLSEGKNLILDLLRAAAAKRLTEKYGEIVRFRFWKAVGTVKGLWNDTILDDVRKKEAIFFDKSR